MASNSTSKTVETQVTEQPRIDLTQGIAYAAKTQADLSAKAIQTAKELTSFTVASLEAFTEANQILSSGSQDLFRELVHATGAASAEVMSGYRSLAAAKSVRERIGLQASLTQASASWALTQANHFAQASIDLAAKASAPLTARMALAAEALTSAKV